MSIIDKIKSVFDEVNVAHREHGMIVNKLNDYKDI